MDHFVVSNPFVALEFLSGIVRLLNIHLHERGDTLIFGTYTYNYRGSREESILEVGTLFKTTFKYTICTVYTFDTLKYFFKMPF